MAFHGIDLHLDSFLDARLVLGEKMEITNTKYYLKDKSFSDFKESLSKDDYVIIEACANAFWLYDQIKNLVKECYILDVNKYKRSQIKTDKLDAVKLAKRLAYYITAKGDSDDLPVIYVPDVKIRELRGLFSTYKLNRKIITQCKNRIHSILKQNGLNASRKEILSLKFREKITEMDISGIWRFQIETLLSQLDAVDTQTDSIRRAIYLLGYELFKNEIGLLLSIKGFSPLTAIALMSDVVDIERFTSAKKFCAYLRTAPTVKSSNNTTRIGNTNRHSRSLTCTLMTQSVNHFGEAGEYLTKFYDRVKTGKKPGVYRMALIRKTLVCAYYMLKRKKHFYWKDDSLYNQKMKDFEREILGKKRKKICRAA